MSDLHAAIMNMDPREGPSDFGDHLDEQLDAEYKRGFRDARHAAAELAALAPAVPPGWMLVPVEPTREQVMAAHNGPLGADEYRITLETESWLIEMYAAFIAAAPSAKEPPHV